MKTGELRKRHGHMHNLWKIGIATAGAFVYTLLDGRKLSTRRRNSALARGKRFVVVGGGFAGVEAAAELVKQLARDDDATEVVLVDQNDYLLFTPMLTEAVGAQVEAHHIIVPLKSFSPKIRVLKARVKDISLAFRTVSFEDSHLQTLQADYLILSLGATSNFHHIEGVAHAAYTLKSLEDARRIKDQALQMLNQSAMEDDGGERRSMLTFVVAGGGYTGVETIAALNELVRERATTNEEVRTLLVEPTGRLMSEVSPALASYAQDQLENAGIEVKLNVGINKVDGDEIVLSDGEHLRSKTLIWTAGVEANPMMSKLGAATGKVKSIKVDESLAVPNVRGVWAVGDCAEIPEPGKKKSYGKTAQNATREGRLAAQNIFRQLRGKPVKPFRYKPIGQLALVGRHRGIAQISGFRFSGLVAYMMWRAIYIAKMPSMSQRLRVISDWLLDVTLGPAAEYPPRSISAPQEKAIAAQH